MIVIVAVAAIADVIELGLVDVIGASGGAVAVAVAVAITATITAAITATIAASITYSQGRSTERDCRFAPPMFHAAPFRLIGCILRAMAHALHDRGLDEILAGVSRSFHLSLSAAPRAVRSQLATTYLVARAADTIADTHLITAAARLPLLGALRGAILDGTHDVQDLGERIRGELGAAGGDGDGPIPMQRRLLERTADCLTLLHLLPDGDLGRARQVLALLIRGMEQDLVRFAPDGSGAPRAIATLAELDEHTYLEAGCVGEFWSDLCAAHLPAAAHLAEPEWRARAARLGKALQLVNVMRDAPADLAEGRCYLPSAMLAAHGLVPRDLLTARRVEARPVLDELRHLALEHVDAAWPWVTAIPRRAARLRLTCIWPLWIALGTLAKIAAADDPLAPGAAIKVHRKEVYRIVAESTAVVGFAAMLSRRHWNRRALAGVRDMSPPPEETAS